MDVIFFWPQQLFGAVPSFYKDARSLKNVSFRQTSDRRLYKSPETRYIYFTLLSAVPSFLKDARSLKNFLQANFWQETRDSLHLFKLVSIYQR